MPALEHHNLFLHCFGDARAGQGHLAKWPELSGVDNLEGEEVVKPL